MTNKDVVSPINTELSGLGLDVNMEYESMVQDRKSARAKRGNLLKEVVDTVNPMRWETPDNMKIRITRQ